ncbi:MAG: hypothetical protein M0Z28_25265 [Rhodospirillales bacterium]|nr:hypothetical protein [Rhodospirillales bacterium]
MSDAPAGRGGRLVLAVGLHGSASTWVFNVAREVLEQVAGADAVDVCHATTAADVVAARRPGRTLVAKTHGWPELPAFAAAAGAVVLVSVRDPRDAALSLMQRFGDSLDVAVGGIGRDCLCIRACAASGHPVFRYEDRFFDDPATVGRIADRLGVTLSPAQAAAIFARWRTEQVRARAAAVRDLPADQRSAPDSPVLLERRTLVTSTHIGDGASGKWRQAFDPALQQRMSAFFRMVLLVFGYPLA